LQNNPELYRTNSIKLDSPAKLFASGSSNVVRLNLWRQAFNFAEQLYQLAGSEAGASVAENRVSG
jgi:hypothetical protein